MQFGFGFDWSKMRFQTIYKMNTFETDADGGYNGKLDLSSLLLTVGFVF